WRLLLILEKVFRAPAATLEVMRKSRRVTISTTLRLPPKIQQTQLSFRRLRGLSFCRRQSVDCCNSIVIPLCFCATDDKDVELELRVVVSVGRFLACIHRLDLLHRMSDSRVHGIHGVLSNKMTQSWNAAT